MNVKYSVIDLYAPNTNKKSARLRQILRAAGNKATEVLKLGLGGSWLQSGLESVESPWPGNETAESANRVRVNIGPFGIEFVALPAGGFWMGSSDGGSDEQPPHHVAISRSFQLGRYQVTQGQWKALMGTNPSYFNTDDSLPVESVSWPDVQQFIARLNAAGNDGFLYRLPTEAEWEFACRAGTKGDFAGNLEEMGWFGRNSGGKTHSVGLKKPNAWGLSDMHGNVWEWTEDWYSSSYYLKSPQADPPGPPSGTYRVVRGGGWIILADCCRSGHRDGRWPGNRSYYVGFRLLRTNR